MGDEKMIRILGPDWPTISYLQDRLREVPETGEFRIGGTRKNSIEQLTAFRAAGLHTPDFTTNREEAREWVREQSLVFGRKLFHTRGNDIQLPSLRGRVNRHKQPVPGEVWNLKWWQSEWWSKYVLPVEEWRIHIFKGKSIARGKKIHSHPDQTWRKAPIRNIGNGWTFDFHTEPPKSLRKVAKQAMEAIEYSSGAVDILQVAPIEPRPANQPEWDFYVLECNRIPALTCPYTQEVWVRAIRGEFQ